MASIRKAIGRVGFARALRSTIEIRRVSKRSKETKGEPFKIPPQ
jgi:hypothetical protein